MRLPFRAQLPANKEVYKAPESSYCDYAESITF